LALRTQQPARDAESEPLGGLTDADTRPAPSCGDDLPLTREFIISFCE
jgi:hypothetical protein